MDIGTVGLIILIMIIPLLGGLTWLLFSFLSYVDSRCPHCKRFRARTLLSQEKAGILARHAGWSDLARGREIILRRRYKLRHRCKYCGHTWTTMRSRPL